MLVASAIASANAVSSSEQLEVTAGYVGLVVVSASMVLGIVDFVMMLFTYIPTLRKKLSLRSRGLASTIQHSNERGQKADHLGVPMLVVAAPINQVMPTPLAQDLADDDDKNLRNRPLKNSTSSTLKSPSASPRQEAQEVLAASSKNETLVNANDDVDLESSVEDRTPSDDDDDEGSDTHTSSTSEAGTATSTPSNSALPPSITQGMFGEL